MFSYLSYRLSASFLSAFAVSRAVNGSCSHSLQLTPSGFDCIFYSPNELSIEDLPRLNRELKECVSLGGKIDHVDMVTKNAAQLLTHTGQYLLAENISPKLDLIPLLNMGQFFHTYPEDSLRIKPISDISELSHVKLTCITTVALDEGFQICLSGVVTSNFKELKKEVKRDKEGRKCRYSDVAKELGLSVFLKEKNRDFFAWTQKGSNFRETFIEFWKSLMLENQVEFLSFPEGSSERGHSTEERKHFHNQMIKVLEGKSGVASFAGKENIEPDCILSSADSEVDWISLYGKRKEWKELLSLSLSFCLQLAKNLEANLFLEISYSEEVNQEQLKSLLDSAGFKYEFVREIVSGCSILPHYQDSFERLWQIGELTLKLNGDQSKIHQQLLESVEKTSIFTLEHGASQLPLQFSPQKVLFIFDSVKASSFLPLFQKLSKMKVSYGFADSKGSVKQKIYSAEKVGIPYTVILGLKDIKSEVLSLRKRGHSSSTRVSFEAFFSELKNMLENELL